MGPPAPPAAPPIWSGLRLPEWLTSDWPLVGLGVTVMLAVLFAVSALFGAVAGVATSGKFGAAGNGAAVGSHLAFAAFGAKTAVSFGRENGSALALQFLPLPWAVVGGLAMGAALRFARPRLPDERKRRIGYAAKLAAAGGVALGVIAGVLDQRSRPGAGFSSRLNGGEVWFYATVLLLLWGWLWLHRQGYRIGPQLAAAYRPLARRAREGALAFLAVSVAFAFVGLVFSLVVVDRNGAQVAVLFGVPVVGLSFGAAMADFAMGAALGLGSLFAQPIGHLSLAHFGLPPGPDAGAAPVWLFAILLVAPLSVAGVVWRHLERLRPAQEQDALAVGAATAVGFAGAAWLMALVGRVALVAAIAPPGDSGDLDTALGLLQGRGSGIGTLISVQPNPVTVLFLALVWGLAGGLGAAFLWASRHNARWQVNSAGDASPTPPAQPGAPAGNTPSGPPGDGPTEPVGSGPASGSPSAAAVPRGTGDVPAMPLEAVPSQGTVGQEPDAGGDPPEEKP
jgi:hypothetical protein